MIRRADSAEVRRHTPIDWPPRHRGTERLGFDARRNAPVTRPDAVLRESEPNSGDSCTTASGRVLGLLRRPTHRTRSAFTLLVRRARPQQPCFEGLAFLRCACLIPIAA